jgi:CheY-like chemotaxis protein
MDTPASSEAASPSLRVLVVDDVAVNRSVASALLRSLGHSSEIATTGMEAFYLAIQVRFDVVLLDLSMPELDGIEVARMFRLELPKGSATGRRVFILGTTAGTVPEDVDNPPGGGMDAWIQKPLSAPELRTALAGLGGSPFQR